ncbi:MAG: hypothetical protein ACJ79S_21905 [Gemmatimonadaceae bacterium]
MAEREYQPEGVQAEGVGEPAERRRAGGESVEGLADGAAASGAPDAGENVPREARSEEGIPPSPQGDGAGEEEARQGNRHKGNPAVGDVGA